MSDSPELVHDWIARELASPPRPLRGNERSEGDFKAVLDKQREENDSYQFGMVFSFDCDAFEGPEAEQAMVGELIEGMQELIHSIKRGRRALNQSVVT